MEPRQYWNYLRRQLFVLDTYSNDHNRRTNHIMALLHCYGSWSFTIPAATTCAWAVLWGAELLRQALNMLHSPWDYFSNMDEGGSSRKRGSGTYASHDWCCGSETSAVVFGVGTLYMATAAAWMITVIFDLLCELNVELTSRDLRRRFSWLKLCIGFWVANTVLPLCMLYTFASRDIEWAGVRYRRRGGKVVHVAR